MLALVSFLGSIHDTRENSHERWFALGGGRHHGSLFRMLDVTISICPDGEKRPG